MRGSTKKSKLLCISLHLFHFYLCTKAANSDAATCFANQELHYFCNVKGFDDAKKACEDNDSYLVKIDTANMTEIINLLIDRVKCPYKEDVFVGATAGSKRVWTWLDGSRIYLPGKTDGYHNWQSGQPNDIGGNEDCLILDKWNKQWKDSPCGNTVPPEPKHYICQKNAEINVEVNTVHNGRQCIASASSCGYHAEWRLRSKVVTDNISRTIYQVILNGSSLLHYGNATIGDAGQYTCVAWLDYDNADKKFVVDSIYVNGTPEIDDIRSFPCNASLQISWKPHFRSLGFRHRIIAHHAEKIVRVNEVTPKESALHLSEIAGLELSTKYNVKVIACKDVRECSDEYSVEKTATLGEILTVANATVQQTNATGNDTCIVTWQWLYNISATFQINLLFSSKESPEVKNDAGTVGINGSKNWSFEPRSEKAYVEILPVLENNDKYCPKPVRAVGSCVGKDKHETVNEEEESKDKQTNVMMFIIPSAAVGGVLLLAIAIFVFWKRMKSTPQPSEGMTSNPIYGATDYGHLHSSSNLEKVSEEDAGEGCSTIRNENSNDAAYATAADLQSSSDAPIYATVDKANRKAAEKEGSSGETKMTTLNEQAAEEMVVNPIYDMEPSTSTAAHDQPATSRESDARKFAGNSAEAASATDDPIYSAVDKVKKKKKKKRNEPNSEHD